MKFNIISECIEQPSYFYKFGRVFCSEKAAQKYMNKPFIGGLSLTRATEMSRKDGNGLIYFIRKAK